MSEGARSASVYGTALNVAQLKHSLSQKTVKSCNEKKIDKKWYSDHTGILRQKDSNGDDCEKYLQKSIELCARVATHSPKDAEFYQIYAGLVSFDGQTNTGRQVKKTF